MLNAIIRKPAKARHREGCRHPAGRGGHEGSACRGRADAAHDWSAFEVMEHEVTRKGHHRIGFDFDAFRYIREVAIEERNIGRRHDGVIHCATYAAAIDACYACAAITQAAIMPLP